MRKNKVFGRVAGIVTLAAAVCWQVLPANAAIIYVEANSGVSGNTVNNTTGSPTDFVGATNLSTDGDWFNRTSGTEDFSESDAWETLTGNEDVPVIKTTATGLVAGTYDVYVYYGAVGWSIAAGLDAGNLTTYSSGTVDEIGSGSFTRVRSQIGDGVSILGGSLDVFIDSAGARTYYDGIGYELVEAATVPEPTSVLLIIGGVIGIGLVRRLRRTNQS